MLHKGLNTGFFIIMMKKSARILTDKGGVYPFSAPMVPSANY